MTETLGSLPPSMYVVCQMVMCAIMSAMIFSLWRSGSAGPQRSPLVPDRVFPWFGAAVGSWAVVSAVLLLKWHGALANPESVGKDTRNSILFWRLLSSPINSGLLVVALRHIDHSPEIFKRVRCDRHWYLLVAAAVVVVVALIVVLRPSQDYTVFVIPDVGLSFVTSALVAYSFYRSFRARGFRWLSVLAVASIVLIAVVQVFELDTGLGKLVPSDWRWALSLSSKAVFIAMFFALAFSWARNTPPIPASSWILRFKAEKSGEHNRPWLVEFGVEGAEISMPLSHQIYVRLLRFAVDRKVRGDDSSLALAKDLGTDATGVRRIGDQLGCPWEDLHDTPAKGCQRLKIPPERIIIEAGVAELDGEFEEILKPLLSGREASRID